MEEEQKVSEVVAKLREAFAPFTEQLTPEMEPADVYAPDRENA
jgi:hypothetical protein